MTQIVTRRDRGAALSWFANRTVTLWGCGALGGHVAEHLTRAGVKKLILRDNGVVTPGILVRQPFDDADVGRAKVFALRDRLVRIRPDLEVEAHTGDILAEPLGGPDWTDGADVVIDATASTPVMGMLERCRWTSAASAVPVVSLAVGHDALRGKVTVSRSSHSGGPLDLCRRLKLAVLGQAGLAHFARDFWPETPRPFFQPEPGCSDATFVGSSADVAALAAVMLNRAAADFASDPPGATATAHLVAPCRVANGERGAAGFQWGPDYVTHDIHSGYQIRITPAAWASIRDWVALSRERLGPEVETGGLLFGERDDATGIIWVTEASGPPPDSIATAEEFTCGTAGTAELNAEKRGRTGGSVHFVGMWHTHPHSVPLPSSTDLSGMRRLVGAAGGGGRPMMLIIGHPHDGPIVGTYVFRAADFQLEPGAFVIRQCTIRSLPWADRPPEPDSKDGGQ